ncbi:MAG: dihydroorotate dehydrogenase electron transfer subunit [Chloroflexi bacterium]|nr:dihydroorotate dehydrogenase electron transfer subunit [Chloroflexota bacterium]MBU1746938.1 dihydroorotate dehydrogenase electron transfer subunit [Chloroflexota bacterium]
MTLHRPFTVSQIRVENARTRTLVFREPLPAQPGQFIMAWLPGVDEKPYSIANAEPLTLTVAAVGPFSEALHRLDMGGRVWVRGPLGQGFHVAPAAERLLLVGGGYGVAPLLFLAREAVTQGCAVEVCIGARTAEDVLLVSDFAAAGATVRIATEDGSLGVPGLVTATVEAAIATARPDMVCACGPAPMLEAVAQLCADHKLPCQLSWEAHLRCGLGLCGSCELPDSGWLVCRDGPVAGG